MPQGRVSESCMVIQVPQRRLNALRAAVVLFTIPLAGCSFDLGSLGSPSPEKDKPQLATEAPVAETAVSASNVSEAQQHATQGQALAQSGKSEAALEQFNRAVSLDPYNAQALYGRAMIYQASNQHEFAIADFTAASGLNPQKSEPLLGRATSYLAIGKVKEAAADLDEASTVDPNNVQVWTTRGLAYERLSDRTKAAASYSRALALRPKDEAARGGLARVGG